MNIECIKWIICSEWSFDFMYVRTDVFPLRNTGFKMIGPTIFCIAFHWKTNSRFIKVQETQRSILEYRGRCVGSAALQIPAKQHTGLDWWYCTKMARPGSFYQSIVASGINLNAINAMTVKLIVVVLKNVVNDYAHPQYGMLSRNTFSACSATLIKELLLCNLSKLLVVAI